jgi:hypothetical protein
MQLPREPGLQRRLTYGENLRRSRSIRTHSPVLNFNSNFHFITRNSVTKHSNSGVSLKNLIKNSKINISKYNFFCSICHQDSNEHSENIYSILRELNCKHSFHITCIETWLSDNNTCPICRQIFI